MKHTLTRGLAAATLSAGLVAGAVAAPAVAHEVRQHPTCTVTAAQKAEARDQRAAYGAQLKAARPTAAQRVTLRAAIHELVVAADPKRLTAAERSAKRREFVALAHKLGKAKTATERVAIRAEMRAIAKELRPAKLTHAERVALRAKIADLRNQIAPQTMTKAERREVRKQIRALNAKLRCATAS